MFRHKENTTNESAQASGIKSSSSQEEVGGVVPIRENRGSSTLVGTEAVANAGQAVKAEPSLKELIEKNLKWSQIIYEQNRKINNKLLWTAVAGWLRLLVIVVPLVLGILFLGPMLKGVVYQYGDLLGNGQPADTQPNSMDNFLKLFNLDPAKQEQLKALLK